MADVVIYSTTYCPYCDKAKQLFKSLGQIYQEINIQEDMDEMKKMIQLSGGLRTVPQIFIDGTHMGGSDDVHALHRQGKLEPLLK